MIPRTKIDRALQNIILTQPFYGSLLLLLDIVEIPEGKANGTTDFATNGTQLLYLASGVEKLNSDEKLVVNFDFNGVESISTGFAKELFGELYRALQKDFPQKIKIILPKDDIVIKSLIMKGISSVKEAM
jgi:hypothetical protein